jgi:hypothetical protein
VTEIKLLSCYEDVARAVAAEADWQVIDVAGESDYQGWGTLLLQRGNEWASIGWSHGSCGGRCPYANLGEDEVTAAFRELIEPHTDETSARLAFAGKKGW